MSISRRYSRPATPLQLIKVSKAIYITDIKVWFLNGFLIINVPGNIQRSWTQLQDECPDIMKKAERCEAHVSTYMHVLIESKRSKKNRCKWERGLLHW